MLELLTSIVPAVMAHSGLLSGGVGLASAALSHFTPAGWIKWAVLGAGVLVLGITLFVYHTKVAAYEVKEQAWGIAEKGYIDQLASLRTEFNTATSALNGANSTINRLTVDKDAADKAGAALASRLQDLNTTMAATTAADIGAINHAAVPSDDVESPALRVWFDRLRSGPAAAGYRGAGSPAAPAR